MTAATIVETRSMPKKQKTFYLNEELSKLVDAYVASTGASFTKIVTAALLQYFFESTRPDPRWMKVAVGLERGDIELGKLPLLVAEARKYEAEQELDLSTREGVPKDAAIDWWVSKFQGELSAAEEAIKFWTMQLEDREDDALQVVIEQLAHGAYHDIPEFLRKPPYTTDSKTPGGSE